MPSVPFIVNGIITKKDSVVANYGLVKITTTVSGVDVCHTVTADVDGKYLIDLGNLGFTDGETASYEITDKFLNEVSTGTFTVTGDGTELNVTTSPISADKPIRTGYGEVRIVTPGGKPVSYDNPLYVKTV